MIAVAVSFSLKRRLGAGSFGEVWLAYERALGVDRAVKLIPPSKVTSTVNFFHEAQILKELEHPHIIRVEEAGTMEDGRLYIAMQYEPRGSVADEAEGAPLPMRRAVRLVCDALRGLEHAHSHNIVHRDIKPANILVGARQEGKLSDFGLAARMGAAGRASPQGYLYHAAPEMIEDEVATHLTDIYAVGVTLYRLLNGDEYLPALDHLADYARAICDGTFPNRRRYRLFVPRALKTVVNRAMNVEPHKRDQSAHELRAALEQVTICCEWVEHPLSDGTRWAARLGQAELQVDMARLSRGQHHLETRRRVSSAKLRRVVDACGYDLTLAEARRLANCVLTDYVNGHRR